MAAFNLTSAQAAAVQHRGGPLLIAAGAGSGKTRVLVERLLDRVVRDGLDIDRFLVITYTRAAAAELRSRILAGLYQRLGQDPANRHVRRQTALVYQAPIGTIHSFCGQLLRENAQLCGIRPDFRQMDEAEQAVLRGQVLAALLQERYGEMTAEFRALADALGAGRDDQALAEVVQTTYDGVQSHPDPLAWLEGQLHAPAPTGDAAETVWGALLLKRAAAQCRYWLDRMTQAREALGSDEKLAAAYGPSFDDTLVSLRGFLEALGKGWDAAYRYGGVDFPRLGALRGRGEDPVVQWVKAVRDSCKGRMKRLLAGFDAPSGALVEDLAQVRPITDALFRLVRDFSLAYSREKRKKALLDFGDLEHLALGLLTGEDGAPSPQAEQVSRRYAEILVDEYQDCNRVQDRIFWAVAREGNVTMVGDVKQSIYRFRLADPGIFLERYAAYAQDPAPGQGRRVILAENFRSDGGILQAVNQLFGLIMTKELGELDYDDQAALLPGPAAAHHEDAFALTVLEYGEADRLEAEAEAVARHIRALLDSGMTVPSEGGERPLQASDVAILLRATKGRDSVYAKALARQGVPSVSLKAAESLRDRREVDWAICLLQVIDNPRQDIPLIAALRSPVWRFDDERLAQVRCADKTAGFYDALTVYAQTNEAGAAVLRDLTDFRLAAAELSTDRLLAYLYARTQLPAAAEARESGSSANLDLLLSYASSYEQAGYRGLFSFVDQLREAADRASVPLTAAKGGGNGVCITSIHGSKGLEYPVVILADLAKHFNKADSKKPLLIHPDLGAGPKRTDLARGIEYPTLARLACAAKIDNETLSEEMRVLYVAMTRARQKLMVFCSVKDAEKTGEALALRGTQPLAPQALEECQSPAEWLLLASLALGTVGSWRWQLTEAAPAPAGAAAETAAAEAETPAQPMLAAQVQAGLSWRYPWEADTRLPSKLTATELKGGFAAQEAARDAEPLWRLQSQTVFRRPVFIERAGGLSPTEQGTALHLAMQYADLTRCGTPMEAAAQVQELCRRHMLSPAQAEAVDPAALSRYDNSMLGQLMHTAEAVHREFKFSLLAPADRFLPQAGGQVLLQGVVDCWLETAAGLVVIDYKTDRVDRSAQQRRAAQYVPQLDAYAYALETITGKPVVKRYLYFFATGDAVEV